MRVTMHMDSKGFTKKCEAAISHVGRATYKATEEACEDIMEESLNQVPRDTNTLAYSAFYEVIGSYKNFRAELGYGGSAVNPKSGQSVDEYAAIVHEDLEAIHPVGKAKFLEDPLREWSLERFPRTIIKHVDPALEALSDE